MKLINILCTLFSYKQYTQLQEYITKLEVENKKLRDEIDNLSRKFEAMLTI